MAICEECGKEYLTIVCVKCRNKNKNKNKNKIIINDSKKINKISQKTTFEKPKKKISTKLLLIATIFIIISILSYKTFFVNPLIGTWQANTKVAFMGNQQIKFTDNSMRMMGFVSKVDYEVSSNEIIVTDATGTGMIFKMVNDKTMYMEMMGMRVKYIKIK